ncbi:uncharacterized protein TNCV_2365041 [Trichonephila clavipes]|nr:uncharacterized protein TNCV_2365041 [Trichonephila clavipes]
MISHTCSMGERSDDLAGQGNISTLGRAHCVTTEGIAYQTMIPVVDTVCPRPQTIWLQELFWPSSDQHMVITGPKIELASLRKHNRSPFRPLMSSCLTPLESQMTMAWS